MATWLSLKVKTSRRNKEQFLNIDDIQLFELIQDGHNYKSVDSKSIWNFGSNS